MTLLISVLIYLGTYVLYLLLLNIKKRNLKDIRWLSLITLVPIIISSIFISDELVKGNEMGKNEYLYHVIILFIMIYIFRLYQEWVNNFTEKSQNQ